MKKKTNSRTALGCLFLFALPFAAVGTFAGYRIAAAVWDNLAMRSWVEVPARIVSAELVRKAGDDSTTYQAKATYRYRFEGVEHTGSRVSLMSGSDNVGDYHRDVHAELSRHRREGTPFRAYVNPERPSESVLYRDPRWGMIGLHALFGIVFGGAGFGLMAGGLYVSPRAKREEQLEALHPEEPWLHKEEWYEARIPSSTKNAFYGAAIMAVFWNAVSAPVFFLVPREIERGNTAALIGLLFPIVGVGLLVWAARSFVRSRKFGESVLRLSTLPGVIGGPLEGTIHASAKIVPEGGFRLTLSSIRRRRSGRGKNRSTRESVLWQSCQVLGTRADALDPGGTEIPVSFGIPHGERPTDASEPDDRVLWKLAVDAAVRGVDYHCEFEVPVFRTPQSSPEYVHDDSGLTPLREVVPAERIIERALARVEPLPAGKRFVFPMARFKGTALATTSFFLLWTGIVVVLFRAEDVPRLFPWLFGGFDLLILLGVLDLWFHRSTVEISAGELRLAGGLFGLGRAHRIARTQLDSVRPKRGMQSGKKLFYQIEVTTRDGKSLTAAKRIPDLETAQRICEEIHASAAG